MPNVRAARSDDAEQLFRLAQEFPAPTRSEYPGFLATLEAKLADPRSCLLVADDETALIGYLSGYCHPAFYAAGVVAWVDEILVTPSHRASGVGTLLMAAFESWAHDRGCVLVSLATAGARGFYERLGYTTKAAYYKKYF